ncbi:MAG TPA: hypothetical protein VL356_05370 [Acidocella sp.]|jgi:hypothetical protein|nr:hypothetical protein [Acidocella sp.]
MVDRPILFSAPMVRALLAGTKTQTRRFLKPQPASVDEAGCWYGNNPQSLQNRLRFAIGDRLWVRESWWHVCAGDGPAISAPGDSLGRDGAFFRADHPDYPPCPHYRSRPSIHMPRWASRLTLTVTDVRVQRLQDISEEDARAEGYPGEGCGLAPKVWYGALWEQINGIDSWDADPWIVALTFDVRKGNIDG